MGLISKGIGKLPNWAQAVVMILAAVCCVWGFAHYGWSFLLRVIFSPDL